MQLPAMLTYNELDGMEVRAILQSRFDQIMENVPYFKRHLTLPRVRMTLDVKLEVWADQPSPETIKIGDKLTVVLDQPVLVDTITAQSVDSTAPGTGHPADELREVHGLPTTQPARGPKDIGGQIIISDQHLPLEGRTVEDMPGLKINRTGQTDVANGGTLAIIDQGPAGLRFGRMNRENLGFRKGVPVVER